MLRILLATLIGLILLGYVLLQLPSVQNYLGHVVANRISKAIGTEVKVGKVGFSLFDKLDVEDLLIKDQKNDTLIYAKSFKLRISDLFFSSNDPSIKYIGLDNAKVNINIATLAQLEELPGIGPVTASKIISDRPYQTVDDLLNKKIVGKAIFEKIKDLISLY